MSVYFCHSFTGIVGSKLNKVVIKDPTVLNFL